MLENRISRGANSPCDNKLIFEVIAMRKVCFLSFVLIVVSFCFVGCNSNNPWIPEVQGSHVSEMPYEQINGDFTVGKYTDFKSFKKSELAEYNFIQQRIAKEERYSAEFFKTRDLAVIKFNKAENGIEYTVVSADIDGNECCVNLLPVKRVTSVDALDTTYYCFLETEKDLTDLNLKLEFLPEIIHESAKLEYVSPETNLPYLFKNEATPVMFKIDSVAGIKEFIEKDEVLDEYNFVSSNLLMYSDEDFSQSSLLLVRVPSSFLESCCAYINNDVIEVVGIKSNHYMYGWEKDQEFSALIAVPVSKHFTPSGIVRTNYTEYEDNADNKSVRNEYALINTTTVTENLTRYDFK